MSTGFEKLITTRQIMISNFENSILIDELRLVKYELYFRFTNGIRLYIRYNDFNKYAYQIVFSDRKLDRIRYDNYDDLWDVKSKPHHCHLRFESTVSESSMTGDPNVDIRILVDELRKLAI